MTRSGNSGGLRTLAWVIIVALMLYVGSLLLIMLDLGVLETGFVEYVIPEKAYDSVDAFYRPLTWLFEVLFR